MCEELASWLSGWMAGWLVGFTLPKDSDDSLAAVWLFSQSLFLACRETKRSEMNEFNSIQSTEAKTKKKKR